MTSSPTFANTVDTVKEALLAKVHLICECGGFSTMREGIPYLGHDGDGRPYEFEVVVRADDQPLHERGDPYVFVEVDDAAEAAVESLPLAFHAPDCDQLLRPW